MSPNMVSGHYKWFGDLGFKERVRVPPLRFSKPIAFAWGEWWNTQVRSTQSARVIEPSRREIISIESWIRRDEWGPDVAIRIDQKRNLDKKLEKKGSSVCLLSRPCVHWALWESTGSRAWSCTQRHRRSVVKERKIERAFPLGRSLRKRDRGEGDWGYNSMRRRITGRRSSICMYVGWGWWFSHYRLPSGLFVGP